MRAPSYVSPPAQDLGGPALAPESAPRLRRTLDAGPRWPRRRSESERSDEAISVTKRRWPGTSPDARVDPGQKQRPQQDGDHGRGDPLDPVGVREVVVVGGHEGPHDE